MGWLESRISPYEGLFLNYSVNGGQNWQATDVQIDDGNMDVYTWKFIVNGNKIYCVWENGLDVFFDRSLNNGADWLDADHRVNVSDAGDSMNPDFAVDGSIIYVFWDRNNSGYKINYSHSEDGGLTWDATDRFLNNYYFPQVGMANGLVHLSFKQGDYLYYRKYDSALDVWTNAFAVRGSDVKDFEVPAMAVSRQLVFFAWQDEVCLDRSVRYNYSLNGGNFSFASDTHMFLNYNPCSGANVSDPVIAVTGNTVYVAWVDWANVYFTRGIIRTVLPFLNLLME